MVEYVSVWSPLAKSSFNVLVASTPVWHEMTTKMTRTIIIKIVLLFPKPIFENSSYISCCVFWTLFLERKKGIENIVLFERTRCLIVYAYEKIWTYEVCYQRTRCLIVYVLWENMNVWGMLYISVFLDSMLLVTWWRAYVLTKLAVEFEILWDLVFDTGVGRQDRMGQRLKSLARNFKHSHLLNCPSLWHQVNIVGGWSWSLTW